jgi:UDP-N-acetylmuramate--alanine ligase
MIEDSSLSSLKQVHITGIGGCAASAVAELLLRNGVVVSGSEMKQRDDLAYLVDAGCRVHFGHEAGNIYIDGSPPDKLLYSPAIPALNPDNPELVEAERNGITSCSWEEFIGDYLDSLGMMGVTVSGSEGKGTTAGILTTILQGTSFDPLSILGARVKAVSAGMDSNVYQGSGDCWILEGDEYNRNFHHYHPAINCMVNFQYEHPETYADFMEYKEAFFKFMSGMSGDKILVLRATGSIINFVKEYGLEQSHKIEWFGNVRDNLPDRAWTISDSVVDSTGVSYTLTDPDGSEERFSLSMLPAYMIHNSVAAIICARTLGLSSDDIKENIKRFKGMVRRFDMFKTSQGGVFITDYGHSPAAVTTIISQVRQLFPGRRLHMVFQPHLFSRTFNFFDEFVESLALADRVTLVDIYPAREDPVQWVNRVSSLDLCEALQKKGVTVVYAGHSSGIQETINGIIDLDDVTCFMGAGDMDRYYTALFEKFEVVSYF